MLKYLIDNIYINIAGISAMLLSPFADAIGSPAYWWLFGGLVLLFIFGIFDEILKNQKLSAETIHIPIVINLDLFISSSGSFLHFHQYVNSYSV